ncbi:MAG: hypothetical protein P4L43_09960 [Syntrophobacteraceae bacterium]|nr:hypothetical protein [Syntrophobacteraceae bacterium]
MRNKSHFWGEITAFLALFLDNVGVLVFLSTILIFTFHYPADIIFKRMIPGTALGVFFGDLIYTWMALRLRKATGRRDVTAMPLGLDTPSTIGLAYAVLGPAYVATRDAQLTWQIGMMTLFMIGLVKLATSFCGAWVQRVVPTAGLLGSIGGVGLLLLGFLPLLESFNEIIVGLVAMGLIFSALLGGMELPGRLPAVLIAVVGGTAIHFGLGFAGLLPQFHKPCLHMALCLPVFSVGFLKTLPQSIQYLPLVIPFGIITIIGGINNTESARLAGDDYRTRDILLTEALTSIASAFFGGVAQTTPYIGHPAYKKMGATCWYTLFTGVFIGLGCAVGLLTVIVGILPRAVLAPIFIYIGFEIVSQAYRETPARHCPAVSFCFMPAVANLVMIILAEFTTTLHISTDLLPARLKTILQSLTILSNGFVLTALLWGSMLACLIDGKKRHAAAFSFTCGVLALFGIIHSIEPSGAIYLPWRTSSSLPFMTALAYLLMAAIFLVVKPKKQE